jgi:hypothetical protein
VRAEGLKADLADERARTEKVGGGSLALRSKSNRRTFSASARKRTFAADYMGDDNARSSGHSGMAWRQARPGVRIRTRIFALLIELARSSSRCPANAVEGWHHICSIGE